MTKTFLLRSDVLVRVFIWNSSLVWNSGAGPLQHCWLFQSCVCGYIEVSNTRQCVYVHHERAVEQTRWEEQKKAGHAHYIYYHLLHLHIKFNGFINIFELRIALFGALSFDVHHRRIVARSRLPFTILCVHFFVGRCWFGLFDFVFRIFIVDLWEIHGAIKMMRARASGARVYV